MNKYLYEIWFRYGEFEKDFEHVEIEATSLAEATLAAKDYHRWVFKITLLEINGKKVEIDNVN